MAAEKKKKKLLYKQLIALGIFVDEIREFQINM
jgi:hypothetical protein